MSKAGAGQPMTMEQREGLPKKGDHFRCASCGMAIDVVADCHCNDPAHVHLQCCGQEMGRS